MENLCNCGINCECNTQDFNKDIDKIENLGYDLMSDFTDK